jgi:hypothetical protein
MLVSSTTEYKDRYNAYAVDGYYLDLKQEIVTINFGRYYVAPNTTPVYVDTIALQLTPEETVERMMTVVNGETLHDELRPWAEAKGKEHGIIPDDAEVLP